MKSYPLLLLLLIATCGCTAAESELYSVNQVATLADLRYQQALDNLALVAHNEGALPSFATMDSGMVNIQDTANFDPTTSWAPTGFSSQVLSLFGKHNPDLQWTFEPVVTQPQLAAAKCVCLWALHRPFPPGLNGHDLLRATTLDDVLNPIEQSLSPHFDVEYRMAQLDQVCPNWLHCGSRREVDSCACYKAKCGDTYVWVNPDGMKGLSDFLLIILDIATVVPGSVTPNPLAVNVDVNGCPIACTCGCDPNDDSMTPVSEMPKVNAPSRASVDLKGQLIFSPANGNAITLTDCIASGGSDTLTVSVQYGAVGLSTQGTPTAKTFTDTGSLTISLANSKNGRSASAIITLAKGPVVSGPDKASPDQNGTITFSTGNKNPIVLSDSDASGDSESVQLNVLHGTLALNLTASPSLTMQTGNGTKSVAATGSLDSLNAALNGLIYTPGPDFTGSDGLSIKLTNHGGGSQSAAVRLTLSAPQVLQPTLVATEPWGVFRATNCSSGTRPQFKAMAGKYYVQLPDVCNARLAPIVSTPTGVSGAHALSRSPGGQPQERSSVPSRVVPSIPAYRLQSLPSP